VDNFQLAPDRTATKTRTVRRFSSTAAPRIVNEKHIFEAPKPTLVAVFHIPMIADHMPSDVSRDYGSLSPYQSAGGKDADPLDVLQQVAQLRLVEDGWLEGAGKAPSPGGLNWLIGVFMCHFPDSLPLPRLYPTETGGVLAEWSIGAAEVSLELNLGTHVGEWHALNLESGDTNERTLQCDGSEDWKWLTQQIKGMAQSPA